MKKKPSTKRAQPKDLTAKTASAVKGGVHGGWDVKANIKTV